MTIAMYGCTLQSSFSVSLYMYIVTVNTGTFAMFIILKGGRPANKFRKSQIRNFLCSYNLLDLLIFRKSGTLRICDLRTQSFCDLWTSNFRKSANTFFFSLKIWHIMIKFKFVQDY
jgi:hypothetical protein